MTQQSAMHFTSPLPAVHELHCDEHVSGCVSLCVCLSAHSHTSKTTGPNFTENSTKIWLLSISFAKKPPWTDLHQIWCNWRGHWR